MISAVARDRSPLADDAFGLAFDEDFFQVAGPFPGAFGEHGAHGTAEGGDLGGQLGDEATTLAAIVHELGHAQIEIGQQPLMGFSESSVVRRARRL